MKVAAALAALFTASGSLIAPAHPLEPIAHEAAGATVALGAVNVTDSAGYYLGLFEFYVHTTGVVETRPPSPGAPSVASIAEPWVAAMYYPFIGQNNTTVFKSVAVDKVELDAAGGGTIRFSMTGVGSVKLVLSGSSATPQNTQIAFTTPEQHHGHTWTMFGALLRGVRSVVTGTITKGGSTFKIVPLRIEGDLIAWIGESAAVTIESS